MELKLLAEWLDYDRAEMEKKRAEVDLKLLSNQE